MNAKFVYRILPVSMSLQEIYSSTNIKLCLPRGRNISHAWSHSCPTRTQEKIKNTLFALGQWSRADVPCRWLVGTFNAIIYYTVADLYGQFFIYRQFYMIRNLCK